MYCLDCGKPVDVCKDTGSCKRSRSRDRRVSNAQPHEDAHDKKFPWDLKAFVHELKPHIAEACRGANEERFKGLESRIEACELHEPRIVALEKKMERLGVSTTSEVWLPSFIELKV